ncbi:hypothetical protein NQ318_010736 [Aromia moschata]|uniref:Uncharacterized protein n=1 Tax=Aromia moschata TaxID=1265417 RepID=A0AAV8YL00_9CUCU|nr:hypothetical protein NQ318_010736 [Aromia moschata]
MGPKVQALSHYIFVRATKNDYREILSLMHDTYFKEEPTCHALGVTRNALLDEGALNAMAEGVSVVARCKYDGALVGAAVNESTHPWDPDMKEKFACSVCCPKVKRLLLFYAHVQRVARGLEEEFGAEGL